MASVPAPEDAWLNRVAVCAFLAGSDGALKRRRNASPASSVEHADAPPPSGGCSLTEDQKTKIALAEMVLNADRIIRECLCAADKTPQGGFRYVQPISDLATGVAQGRLPPGCPEMTRLAVVARNLDPAISNPMSMRFTKQYKIFVWGVLKQGSSPRSAHDFRRGRQDPTVVLDPKDPKTRGVYQMFETGELLPSIASLEEFMSKQVSLFSEGGVPQSVFVHAAKRTYAVHSLCRNPKT